MWQFVPIEVQTAEEALQILANPKELFDLALMECELPDLPGVELAERTLKFAHHANLPIVLFTSSTRKPANAKNIARALLTKPIKPSTLHNVVINALARQETETVAPPVPSKLKLGQTNPLRILVAEDNPVNQKVAAAILDRLGYSADIVANGLEAVKAAQTVPYDLILMDVQMPEMDGLQAAQELCRRLDPLLRPRIIALTANVTEEDRRRCLAAGMDTYIAKPVTLGKLSDLLANCLRRATDGPAKTLQPSSSPETTPTPAPSLEDFLPLFWQARAIAQNTSPENIWNQIAQQTLHLRRAIDLGDHATAQSSATALTNLIIGGCPEKILVLLEKIAQFTPADLLRHGIAVIAEIQIQIEQLRQSVIGQEGVSLPPLTIAPIQANEMQQLCAEFGSQDTARTIVHEFAKDFIRQLGPLQQSILRQDAPKIAHIAHSIKGSCSVFPVETLRAAAEGLETAARGGRTSEYAQRWKDLVTEYAACVVALLTAIDSFRST